MNALTFILVTILGVVTVATLSLPGVSASAAACGLCMVVGGLLRGL